MFRSVNSILITASVALLMLGLVPQANAQFRTGRNQSSELTLLGNAKIQEELELVDDQIEEIKEIESEVTNSMRDLFVSRREEMSNASNEERSEMWSEMQKELREQYTKVKPKIESVLLPNQVQRLAEIKMQATLRRSGGLTSERGGQALKEQLGISDEQMEAMKEKASKARETLTAKIAKLRKEAEAEVLSVLDSEQRTKYDEMMGEAFDVDSLFQRGGRGGQRGRGAQGGRGGRGGGQGRRGGSGDTE